MATPGRAMRFIEGDVSALGTLWRHQLGAIAATVVDFTTMIVLVQVLGVSPVVGTALSAPCGGLSNFALGRAWIFRRHVGSAPAQAFRYALVSAASAGWNTLGEHAMHDVARVQYVFARAIVAVAVSLLWNFPMQRYFVFQDAPAA
jgi:putative flippase GtrA